MKFANVTLNLEQGTFKGLTEKFNPPLYSNIYGIQINTLFSYKIYLPSERLQEFKQIVNKDINHSIEESNLSIEQILLNSISYTPFHKTEESLINSLYESNKHLNLSYDKFSNVISKLLDKLQKQDLIIHNEFIDINPKHPLAENYLVDNKHRLRNVLLYNIHQSSDKIKNVYNRVQKAQYDLFYRVYHHSFKAYSLQSLSNEMIKLFKELLPDSKLNQEFTSIFKNGTNIEFNLSHNSEWTQYMEKIVLSYSHSKFFLEALIQVQNEISEGQYNITVLPSAWASILYLYNLR